MSFRMFATVGVVVALVAASASALNLNMANLNANGWKATTTSVYGGATDATVTETSNYGTDNFRFYTGLMPTSWQFQWAGISTDAFAGKTLASITSMKIKNYGVAGDGPKWLPPTFTFVVDKGGGNQRCITWQAWSNGNAREPGVWHEYDAATTGTWHVYETGANYTSLAALKAALPAAIFEYSANLPVAYGYASQQAFNVGNCPLYDEDRGLFNGTAGYVDWFEVGENGVTTRYNLVPEPTSLLLLAVGGLLLGRKK